MWAWRPTTPSLTQVIYLDFLLFFDPEQNQEKGCYGKINHLSLLWLMKEILPNRFEFLKREKKPKFCAVVSSKEAPQARWKMVIITSANLNSTNLFLFGVFAHQVHEENHTANVVPTQPTIVLTKVEAKSWNFFFHADDLLAQVSNDICLFRTLWVKMSTFFFASWIWYCYFHWFPVLPL